MIRKSLLLWMIILAAAVASAAEREIVIRNGTVLTITNGVIQNGSVLIRGSKIAAVGPADSIRANAGATVIDASGKFVMPGIIDSHSHTAIEGAVNEGSLANTGIVRVRDVLTGEDINSYRQLAGGTTTALLLHGSANAIGGQSVIVKWKWGRPVSEWPIPGAPEGIKFALGENPKSSNQSPPTGVEKQYPLTRMGVEEVIRKAFTDARDYTARHEDYARRKARGEDVIPPRRELLMEEMAGILSGKVHVHSHCYRADEIVMLINLAEEMGFRIRTFQHVLEGYKVADEMARHGVGGATFIDWWGFKAESYDGIPHNVALMTRRGVVASVNSDSDELARHLNLDAAKSMKFGGLTEEEALRTCTINPAKQLGIEARVGSIEAGKDADLVIWTGHPLSTYSRVDTTLIEGEIYFDRQKDLAARESRAREKAERIARDRDDLAREKESEKEKKSPDRPSEKKPGAPTEVNR